MASPKLIVLRTGTTQGFQWEIAQAVATLPPERLLLVVDHRREFRRVLEAISGAAGAVVTRVRLHGKTHRQRQGPGGVRGRLDAAAAAAVTSHVPIAGRQRAARVPVHALADAGLRTHGGAVCGAALVAGEDRPRADFSSSRSPCSSQLRGTSTGDTVIPRGDTHSCSGARRQ